MPTPGQELSSIDFESMIGGPLMAVVHAQAQAAMATVNFVKEVGFKKSGTSQNAGSDGETEEPIYVTFKYPKEISPYQPPVAGDATATPKVDSKPEMPAKYEVQQLQLPILTMLPIPFIRVEEATVDFNAKINSVEYRKTDTSFGIDASLEASAGWLWGSAKLKVSTSYKSSTTSGSNVERTYSMAVHVRAVQDEMPAGMEKIMSILQSAITSVPAGQALPTAK